MEQNESIQVTRAKKSTSEIEMLHMLQKNKKNTLRNYCTNNNKS